MSRIHTIFQRLQNHIEIPETELNYTNPYTLLVAVVLSAQSTDKGVNKATESLFEIISTPEQMVKLGVDGLKEYIKTIGLFNTKAANIIKLSQELIDRYDSIVPGNREDLITLPGVGRKTANVVLNVIFDQPTIPVDTHVARVSNRLALSVSMNPDKIESDLERIIPTEFLKDAHHLLVLHGRYTCIARKPKCGECILNELCDSKVRVLI
ncbi:MAG: endonuclease III [Alphaproteobacteria bacterium]|nr:endonuclease III [Alphaproteobacteria bacterium]